MWLIESLKNIDINWHLNIIGHYNKDDQYYNELISLIQKYQLQDKISLLGNISNENMFKYINNSKLFVLPTYYEGFGMALLESSIAGLKVITTDLPVLREVLRNREVDFKEVININSITIAIKNNLENLKVGETVIAIGNPQGLGQSFSIGIVSAINRQFKNKNGSFIQTDASINPGNSGGALIDSKGRLIGITNFIESTSGGSQGLNFAIPVDIVMESYKAIIN